MGKNSPKKPNSQGSEVQTPKKQKNVKQAPANGVTKAKAKKSPNKKLHLIPDEFSKNLNRRQRKRIIHKVVRALKNQGTEDVSTIDPNNATVKEIFNKIVNEDKSVKSDGKQTKAKTPKKTPKKNKAE